MLRRFHHIQDVVGSRVSAIEQVRKYIIMWSIEIFLLITNFPKKRKIGLMRCLLRWSFATFFVVKIYQWPLSSTQRRQARLAWTHPCLRWCSKSRLCSCFWEMVGVPNRSRNACQFFSEKQLTMLLLKSSKCSCYRHLGWKEKMSFIM